MDTKPNISGSRDQGDLKTSNLNERDSTIGRICTRRSRCQKKQNCSPALFNDVVLDRVFGYLNIKDIKSCRLVCGRWKIVSDPHLRKKSAILIPTLNTLKRFTSTFVNSETKMPFDTVIFPSNSTHKWNMLLLDSFFTDWQNQIKTLELSCILVYKFTINPYKCTQVKSLIKKYVLNHDLLCNLTSLTVDGFDSKKETSISLSVDNLRSIKFIDLAFGVMLNMSTTGIKISATEVKLRDIYFLRNGKFLKTVLINDFIDFNKTKIIRLLMRQDSATKLFLDMSESITVDCLYLKSIEMLNDIDSNWNVKHMMFLSGVPWTKRNQVKFTNLQFNDLNDSILDLAALPVTIECLHLACETKSNVISSFPVISSNLRSVSLMAMTHIEFDQILPLFKHCHKLTEVAFCHYNGVVNVEWLAPSVRRLKMSDTTKLNFERNSPFELETFILILDSYLGTETLDKIKVYFNYQNLVICPTNFGSPGSLDWISTEWYDNQVKTTINKFRKGDDRAVIYVGPIAIHKKSPFLKCVDTSTIDLEKATKDNPHISWFRFTSEFGHAIEESEFNKLRNFVNSDRF